MTIILCLTSPHLCLVGQKIDLSVYVYFTWDGSYANFDERSFRLYSRIHFHLGTIEGCLSLFLIIIIKRQKDEVIAK